MAVPANAIEAVITTSITVACWCGEFVMAFQDSTVKSFKYL